MNSGWQTAYPSASAFNPSFFTGQNALPLVPTEQKTVRHSAFESFLAARQAKPVVPPPQMGNKPAPGKFSKMMLLYKFTGGVLLAGILPSFVMEVPFWRSVGIGLIFTTLQYLTTEKIMKGDNPLSRAIVNFSKRFAGQKDRNISEERVKAPIWAVIAGLIEFGALMSNKLSGKEEKKKSLSSVVQKLKAEKGILHQVGSLIQKARILFKKRVLGNDTVKKILNSTELKQLLDSRLVQFIKKHKTATLIIYGVINAALIAYAQCIMAAKIDEKLTK